MLGLPAETACQAVQQALHVTTTTRQSRKGEISSWKAYAPAFAGKMAVEAVDRAMRGEGAPSPIYEGEDGFIAWMLGGPEAEYHVPLPEHGEPKRAILETYTKEHSAEYQSQALIDLARRMKPKIGDTGRVRDILIHTSHHTHYVIGTGADDPQKMDPRASRETLDHSIMYIFAVALQDGGWHHERSYAPAARRGRTRWRCGTKSAPSKTPNGRGATTATIRTKKHSAAASSSRSTTAGSSRTRSRWPMPIRSARGHFAATDYITKFRELADGVIASTEQDRFLNAVERLPKLWPTILPASASPSSLRASDRPSPPASSIGEAARRRNPRSRSWRKEEVSDGRCETRPQEIGRPLRRRCRQHGALHRRPHRQ